MKVIVGVDSLFANVINHQIRMMENNTPLFLFAFRAFKTFSKDQWRNSIKFYLRLNKFILFITHIAASNNPEYHLLYI